MPHQDTTLTPKQVAGNAAEDLASAHLERAGLRILTRNYRVRGGEIDCIALDGNTLVFVEVRLRRNTRFGGAAASIDGRKQQRTHSSTMPRQRQSRRLGLHATTAADRQQPQHSARLGRRRF